VQNFSPLASKLREEFELTDTLTHVDDRLKNSNRIDFLAHSFALLAFGDCQKNKGQQANKNYKINLLAWPKTFK